MPTTLKVLTSTALLSLLAMFAGCGGGSSGEGNTRDGNLSVDVSYNTYDSPARPHVWENVSISPTVVGLGNNTPTFSVPAGQLPRGLSLNARTGEISGVVMEGGRLAFSVTLTVQGFQGSVPASVFLDVAPPVFTYNAAAPIVKATAFRIAPTQSALPPNAQPSYSTDDPNFPSQLTLDPATGEISGSLAAAATYTFFVRCHFNLDGQRAYITTNVSIPVVD